MKYRIATLQFIFLLLIGCATPRSSINPALAKYDTTKLQGNVETARTQVTSASNYVTKAQVHAISAQEVASQLEEQGTTAHSKESKNLVKSIQSLQGELKQTQNVLNSALNEVASAKAETAAVSTNLNDIHQQLVDTINKFNQLTKQYEKAQTTLIQYKQWLKVETIILGGLIVLNIIYFFLKFYLRIPFL